ncbi:heme peroxidase family protein [Paracoccus sp. SSK6]|uniref:peroxidase family protein n=1 Tax=Paracoccus sp. SSK6 TaxID=3143131 RepID=UPI00321912F1
MLFTLGHGQHIIQETGGAGLAPAEDRPDAVPLSKVVEPGSAENQQARKKGGAGLAPAEKGAFRYLFPYAAAMPESPTAVAALDRLADSMVEPLDDPETGPDGQSINSSIAPVMTYLGQFIDHDITANTDRAAPISAIDGDCAPQPRDSVERDLDNLRDGSLRLDSLYGDRAGQGPFADKLAGLMKHPRHSNKMRLGIATPVGDRPPLPRDPAADLLRLGFLMSRNEITEADLNDLPDDLRATFMRNGEINKAHAIIGDDRNDENLLVAQLHVAFLRLHNKLADQTGPDFDAARKATRFHYQWLIVNEYLPAVCDPAIVGRVVAQGAPLYSEFFKKHRPADGAKMPMPLEFSVAAFRFGHSMVRGAYDHNRIFGTAEAGTTQLIENAPFNLLFAFTGGGDMPNRDGSRHESLPDNWIIEWNRFIVSDQGKRAARKIDTRLAPPLKDMVKEAAGVFKHLARRNLRRGYRLSLPTGQECIAAINGMNGYDRLPVLSPEEVSAGRDFMVDAGLDTQTPLWFYILREAELAGGNHLGPLGSTIVADTLVGLVVSDPQSYWHNGSGGQPWAPGNGMDSLQKMLRFIGMIED